MTGVRQAVAAHVSTGWISTASHVRNRRRGISVRRICFLTIGYSATDNYFRCIGSYVPISNVDSGWSSGRTPEKRCTSIPSVWHCELPATFCMTICSDISCNVKLRSAIRYFENYWEVKLLTYLLRKKVISKKVHSVRFLGGKEREGMGTVILHLNENWSKTLKQWECAWEWELTDGSGREWEYE